VGVRVLPEHPPISSVRPYGFRRQPDASEQHLSFIRIIALAPDEAIDDAFFEF
jgi:hypothetical protein